MVMVAPVAGRIGHAHTEFELVCEINTLDWASEEAGPQTILNM